MQGLPCVRSLLREGAASLCSKVHVLYVQHGLVQRPLLVHSLLSMHPRT